MARKVSGDFRYLANKMNERCMSIKEAGVLVGKDYTTVRNWLKGKYLIGVLKGSVGVAECIAKITGDSLEIVISEIELYLRSIGEIVEESSIKGRIQSLIEDIKAGKYLEIEDGRVMSEYASRKVVKTLESNLEFFDLLLQENEAE